MGRDIPSLMLNPTAVDGGAIRAGTGQAHATISGSIPSSRGPWLNPDGGAAGRNPVGH